MGMLMHHTWQKQQEAMKSDPVKEEELPFAEPEEPVEVVKEEVKKTVRKSAPATRRRKTAK